MADTGRSRVQFPSPPKSSSTFTGTWLFGWIAWMLSVAAWLGILILRALR